MSAKYSLWNSNYESDWKNAYENYWKQVKPKNSELEHELNDLKLQQIVELDHLGWYKFLLDKYFRWKYTSEIRYVQNTKHLKRYLELNQLENLFSIKQSLLNLDISDIQKGLSTATEINGLGIAGASGLISLFYPNAFGTVDQFVVKSLKNVPNLPEYTKLQKINEKCSLSLKVGVFLIEIMRRKAKENNDPFGTDFWSPRKIDMVLWGMRD